MSDRGALSERSRLLWRIQRRYHTCHQLLRIGSLEIAFTRIADPDHVLNDAAAAEAKSPNLAHVPYWAELWDSALGLAASLASAPKPPRVSQLPLRDCRVLDLGCGMGLAGCAAAAVGARVTFADLEPLALLFARLNSLPWRDRIDARRVDWRRDSMGRAYDLILGADILYERSQWEYLDCFWQAHLAEHGDILLGEPGRQTGDRFIEWIGDRGWSLARTEQRIEQREKPVRIFSLRRK
jgi:predicted nicotinamide N-methyase